MLWKGRPVTKGRPRLGRRRRVYTPQATLDFENSIAEAWDEQVGETFDGPVWMDVVIGSDWIYVDVYEILESVRPKYIQGDIDNYVKAISDGLNGHAYLDDKQIHMLTAGFSREP